MKVVDIERVVILMRFIQFGWTEERKKAFDEDLRMMLETQCEDLADHDKQIRDEAIDEFAKEMKELVYKWFKSGVINVSNIDKIAEKLKGEQNE